MNAKVHAGRYDNRGKKNEKLAYIKQVIYDKAGTGNQDKQAPGLGAGLSIQHFDAGTFTPKYTTHDYSSILSALAITFSFEWERMN